MTEEKVGLRFVVDGRGAAVGAMGSVRSSLVSVRGAAIATGAALFGVGRALASSVDEAREAERVGKVTERRLKSTGHAANVTAKQIGNLSSAISRKVGIDDEAIQSSATMLLQFTKVRNEAGKGNKIFDRSTRAIVDYAAAMGGGAANGDLNLTTASRTLGKALSDPTKGVTLLAKATGGFTDTEKEQIKTLVESGRTLAAQKILLDKLAVSTKGTAAANATMGDKVSVAWGNIQEQLGTALLPTINEVERAFLKKGVPAIEHYLDVFQEKGVPAISDFADSARPLVKEVLPALGSGLQNAADALRIAAPYAKDIVGAFNDLPSSAKTAIFATGTLGFAAIKTRKMLTGGTAAGPLASVLGKYGGATPVWVVNSVPGAGGGPGSPAATGGVLALLAKLAKSRLIKGPLLLTLLYELLGDGTSQSPEQKAGGPRPGARPFLPFDDYQRYREQGRAAGKDLPVNFLNRLLYDPVIGIQKAAGTDKLSDLYRGTLDVQRGARGATDRVTELQRSIDMLSGRSLMLNTDPARRQIDALTTDLLHLTALASGGLFGGPAPATTPDRPNRPRVPHVPPRSNHPVPRVAGHGPDGALDRPIVVQMVLDGQVIAENTVQHLKNQEARR